MEALFGFKGAGYVLLAADSTSARSIIAYKHDEDKIRVLDKSKMVAAAGPQADCTAFLEYIGRNLALNEFRSGLPLSTKATAAYVRNEMATALRKSPYNVNMLLAGFDGDSGPSLYFMDYLASSVAVNYGAHGYAGFFVSALMDRYWRTGMSLEEGIKLARDCIAEIRTRMTVSHPHFVIKVVDKDGIRELPIDAPAAAAGGAAAAAAAAAAPPAAAAAAGAAVAVA